MSSDDRGNPSGGRDASGEGDNAFSGDPVGDPVREFVLGIATQIDHLAAIIGGGGQTSGSGAGSGMGAGSAPGSRHQAFGDVAGEISSLIAEIGDLISRLIATLIAVLEAIATALRSTPAAHAPATAQYQPISVRIATAPHRPPSNTPPPRTPPPRTPAPHTPFGAPDRRRHLDTETEK